MSFIRRLTSILEQLIELGRISNRTVIGVTALILATTMLESIGVALILPLMDFIQQRTGIGIGVAVQILECPCWSFHLPAFAGHAGDFVRCDLCARPVAPDCPVFGCGKTRGDSP